MHNVHAWLNVHRWTAHPDVWGVDVARVVLFGGHQLHTCVVVGQDILEAVPVAVLRHLSDSALTVGPLFVHLLVLSEHHPLLHSLLQDLTLQETHRTSVQNVMSHSMLTASNDVWQNETHSQNSPLNKYFSCYTIEHLPSTELLVDDLTINV